MRYFFVLLIAVAIASCNSPSGVQKQEMAATSQPSPMLSDSLQQKLDDLVDKLAVENKSRVTLKANAPDGGTYYTGHDGRADEDITDFSGSIDIGSCTKLFTSASVMQLIEKGAFSLETKLTDILPLGDLYDGLLVIDGKDYIDEVKVLNLLNHTSGFPDYFIEGDDEKEIELHGDASLQFEPEELITLAKKTNEPQFVPGSSFKYCNTNYILLGMIIEKVSGQSYQEYMQEHILDPLELENTFFGSVNPPDVRTPGHFKTIMSEMPATLAGAAGEIISDLGDMNKFILAWYNGKLFSQPGTIETIKTEHYQDMMGTIVQYGLGTVQIYGNAFGHGGQTFGFQTFMGATKNGYAFSIAIDDASVSAWPPAISLSVLLNSQVEN